MIEDNLCGYLIFPSRIWHIFIRYICICLNSFSGFCITFDYLLELPNWNAQESLQVFKTPGQGQWEEGKAWPLLWTTPSDLLQGQYTTVCKSSQTALVLQIKFYGNITMLTYLHIVNGSSLVIEAELCTWDRPSGLQNLNICYQDSKYIQLSKIYLAL